jgi:hypothetical protein
MNPALTYKHDADEKLGTGIEIGLADRMDDAGQGLCCGGELGDGERLDGCFRSWRCDGAVGINIFCSRSVCVWAVYVARALVQGNVRKYAHRLALPCNIPSLESDIFFTR